MQSKKVISCQKWQDFLFLELNAYQPEKEIQCYEFSPSHEYCYVKTSIRFLSNRSCILGPSLSKLVLTVQNQLHAALGSFPVQSICIHHDLLIQDH